MSKDYAPQRVYVPLNETEAEALVRLSKANLRHPRDQARLILRQELAKKGLLPAESDTQSANKGVKGAESG